MISNQCVDSTSSNVVEMVTGIYRKFKIECATNDNGEEVLNANILWKWPDYLKENLNKLVKFEDVVYAVNSNAISL